MTRILILIAVILTACTPAEVQSFADDVGFPLQPGEAEAISVWTESQDCLPNYGADQYVECAVFDAAHAYGLSVALMARIAHCESRFDPYARNPRSSAEGLFQFLTGTWAWVGELGAPHAHEDRTHARANAFTAAWLMARPDLGGVNHWVCR